LQATATFPFAAEHDNELSFKPNDIIKLRKWVNAEWLEGELDGRTGMFPAMFVDITEDVGDLLFATAFGLY
jgi:hypothetical protein